MIPVLHGCHRHGEQPKTLNRDRTMQSTADYIQSRRNGISSSGVAEVNSLNVGRPGWTRLIVIGKGTLLSPYIRTHFVQIFRSLLTDMAWSGVEKCSQDWQEEGRYNLYTGTISIPR